mmetsp:Transcript_36744/g.41052  ORF Transcript_36744/g.41052 Transcript_36744/m.41052 type:complete len:168 (+) Transcript_36744:297-800(+)
MPINNSCYTTVSATANAGLKDVVFTSPNKYVGEKKRGNDDDEKALGRQIQYKTTVNFTPVKKSTRKSLPSNGSLASNQKKSSVTHGEMTGIISLLENLYVDHREDETKDDDSQNDNNNNNNNSNRYSIGEDGELLGRIPQFVFSSNGNASTVLRSARKSKKKEPVNV